MPRAKGFSAWRPQKRTLTLLEDVEGVLGEYRRYLPMTVRQVFYRLVGLGYPKTEDFYAKVQEMLNRARRSGRISFASIRDDGVSRRGGESEFGYYESPQDYYDAHEELSNFYERSWHAEQPTAVTVLCEAEGMIPMIARTTGAYRIGVASSSGFDSLTAKYELYRDADYRYSEHDQRTVLLHLGDHDPSGVSLYESMAEDLEAFCDDRGQSGLIEVRRVALLPEQITALGLLTKSEDVKPTDDRSRGFIERGLEPAAQLEAVPPDTLSEIVREAVEDALDMDILDASRERESAEYDEVQEKLDEVNEKLREAFREER